MAEASYKAMASEMDLMQQLSLAGNFASPGSGGFCMVLRLGQIGWVVYVFFLWEQRKTGKQKLEKRYIQHLGLKSCSLRVFLTFIIYNIDCFKRLLLVALLGCLS